MLELAGQLAARGPLRVLDGGNHFNVHIVARTVRRLTARLEEALANIRVARAFTCYQMLALLDDVPAGSTPTLVLDLLSTFYDESVPLFECQRLLDAALAQLQRLGQAGAVVVSARPPAQACRERLVLVEAFAAALPTGFLYPQESRLRPVLQPALFGMG